MRSERYLLYVMYIDETGTPSFKDSPRYFLLTGIVIHENDIKKVKKTVFDFKQEYFKESYIEAEIHMHEMFRSKNDFVCLKEDEKQKLIQNVYEMINELPFTVIGAAIHKPKFKEEHPTWKVLKTALIVLLSRYNQFLESVNSSPEKGIVKMDKSTDKQRSEINEIFKMLQKERKESQVSNILKPPYFVNSDSSEGIQIADAVSFCIGKKLLGNPRFPTMYWELIKEKIFSNNDKILGNGLNIFPHMKELESEDIQP